MVSHIYANLPRNSILRLPHPPSGDNQGYETFLAPSDDKLTRNYDKECYPFQLSQVTATEQYQEQTVSHINVNLPGNSIVRLPHPWSDRAKSRKRFQHPLLIRKLASVTQSAQTSILSNHHKTLRLNRTRIKLCVIYMQIFQKMPQSDYLIFKVEIQHPFSTLS